MGAGLPSISAAPNSRHHSILNDLVFEFAESALARRFAVGNLRRHPVLHSEEAEMFRTPIFRSAIVMVDMTAAFALTAVHIGGSF